MARVFEYSKKTLSIANMEEGVHTEMRAGGRRRQGVAGDQEGDGEATGEGGQVRHLRPLRCLPCRSRGGPGRSRVPPDQHQAAHHVPLPNDLRGGPSLPLLRLHRCSKAHAMHVMRAVQRPHTCVACAFASMTFVLGPFGAFSAFM